MYIATVCMCGCGGCHNSLLSIGEPLVAILCEHTISFSSCLVDRRPVSPSDVVLAMGGIRNLEELDIALEVSRTSRKVLAVGSCAVYGGVPGFAPLPEEVVSTTGRDGVLPRLLAEVEPLDSRIDIDLYIPGCPPAPHLIFEGLKSVLEGYEPFHREGTVCSECGRSVATGAVKSWSEHPGCGAPEGRCLLNSGHLCLGPVTRGGCHAACPGRGAICMGCRGPSDMVLSSQLHSMYSDMVKFASLTEGTKEEKEGRRLSSLLRSIYVFTRRDPVTVGRVKERMGGTGRGGRRA